MKKENKIFLGLMLIVVFGFLLAIFYIIPKLKGPKFTIYEEVCENETAHYECEVQEQICHGEETEEGGFDIICKEDSELNSSNIIYPTCKFIEEKQSSTQKEIDEIVVDSGELCLNYCETNREYELYGGWSTLETCFVTCKITWESFDNKKSKESIEKNPEWLDENCECVECYNKKENWITQKGEVVDCDYECEAYSCFDKYEVVVE